MPARSTCNIGVLVSGRGSNMLAIIRAMERGEIRGATIRVVISDKKDAKALRIAKSHGIRAIWLDPATAATRLDYDREVARELERNGVTSKNGLVLLAGFMRLLSTEFVKSYAGRMMNIHPALLPAFPGLNAQEKALEHGVKVSGCTVHFVVPEVDSGPIIIQNAVKVEEDDTPDVLAARILRQEHRIYPLAVKLFVEGRLRIAGRRVVISRR